MSKDTTAGSDAPIEADFTAADPAPPAKPLKRGPGWTATALMMLLAGWLGGGAVIALDRFNLMPDGFVPAIPAGQSGAGAGFASLDVRLAAAERRLDETGANREALAGLLDTVSRLEGEAARAGAAIDQLGRAVESLRTVDAAGEVSPEDLRRAVAALREDLGRLETGLAGAATRADTGALSATVSDIAGRVDTLEQAGSMEAGEARQFATAIAAIESAARRGSPFRGEQVMLAALRPDDPDVRALENVAGIGAETPAALSARFDDVAERIAAASPASGGALGAAQKAFGRHLSVSPAGSPGPAGAVDAARAALRSGDLSGAVAALEALDSDAAAAAEDWLRAARARIALDDALDGLRLDLLRLEGADR